MKIVAKFLIFLFIFFPICVKGAKFEIITYDVDVEISIDRTANFNEKYNAYFIHDLESIKRVLNEKVTTLRPDNTKRTTNGVIRKINVVEREFNSTEEKDKRIIEIRSNFLKDTVEEIDVSYNYNFGKDTGIGYDEIFLEIIDGSFDTTISGLNFKITLPKEFDSSKIKFAYDSMYNLSEDDVTYSVKDNTIIGTLNKLLPAGSKFQLYIELPEGYFEGATDNYNYMILLLLILPMITLIFAIACLFKYKVGNKLQIKVSNQIPYNFSSAEIAYLYKGYLKEHDLMTLLLEIANRGYIIFEELDDGYKLGRANSFRIRKIKEYDLDDAASKLLFDKLFQSKDVIEISDIQYNLYNTLVEAKGTIDNRDNNKKIFFQDIFKNKSVLFLLAAISAIVANAYSIYLYTSSFWFIPIITGILVIGIYTLFVSNNNLFVKFLFGIGFIVAALYVGIIPIYNEINTLITYIISMLLIFISMFIYKSLPLRTKVGNEYLGTIAGFKKALVNMHIGDLERILRENPNYFYQMYPYIYVFDEMELWITKCSNFVKQYPSWYHTNEPYSIRNFQKFVKNVIFTTTQAMFKRQLEGQSKTHVEYKKDVSSTWTEK